MVFWRKSNSSEIFLHIQHRPHLSPSLFREKLALPRQPLPRKPAPDSSYIDNILCDEKIIFIFKRSSSHSFSANCLFHLNRSLNFTKPMLSYCISLFVIMETACASFTSPFIVSNFTSTISVHRVQAQHFVKTLSTSECHFLHCVVFLLSFYVGRIVRICCANMISVFNCHWLSCVQMQINCFISLRFFSIIFNFNFHFNSSTFTFSIFISTMFHFILSTFSSNITNFKITITVYPCCLYQHF